MLVNWTDILDGAIANAAWGVVSMVKPRTSRRVAADLDTAAWADTDRLIRDALKGIAADPRMPALSEEEVAEHEAELNRHEVQGALQVLLAVRLTDAPETDAAKAREAVRLALSAGSSPGTESSPTAAERRQDGRIETQLRARRDILGATPGTVIQQNATALSAYFDDKICALVANLEGRVGFEGLAQVRAEAYNARVVALLGAIERQVAALADHRRGGEKEADWLARYRFQANSRHGYLYPPDFDRRRKSPVSAIYVNTPVVEHADSEAAPGGQDFAETISDEIWACIGALATSAKPVSRGKGLWVLAFTQQQINYHYQTRWPQARSRKAITTCANVGKYMLDHPELPWINRSHDFHYEVRPGVIEGFLRDMQASLGDEVTALGAIMLLCTVTEIAFTTELSWNQRYLKELADMTDLLYPYVFHRMTKIPQKLPDLPVPAEFKPLFRNWAKGQVNFVEVIEE